MKAAYMNKGCVYVIKTPIGVKIGKSTNPKRRVKTLTQYFGIVENEDSVFITNPHTSYSKTERDAHLDLTNYRITGTEAFTCTFEKAVETVTNLVTINENIQLKSENENETELSDDEKLKPLKAMFMFLHIRNFFGQIFDINMYKNDVFLYKDDYKTELSDIVTFVNEIKMDIKYHVDSILDLYNLTSECEPYCNYIYDFFYQINITQDLLETFKVGLSRLSKPLDKPKTEPLPTVETLDTPFADMF